MIHVGSLEEIQPEAQVVTLAEFFRDILTLIDKKYANIDLCPTKKNRTAFCKHKKSCVHNLVANFFKGFFKFFSAQVVINFIFFLTKLIRNKISLKQIFGEVFQKNTIRMGFFLATYNSITRLITCSGRFWFEKNSPIIDTFAGFIAGLISYPLFNPQLMTTFSYFIFSRLLAITYSTIQEKYNCKRLKHQSILLCGILMSLSGYAFAHEPKYLNSTLMAAYHNFSSFDPNLY